jgi:hypothetical protein
MQSCSNESKYKHPFWQGYTPPQTPKPTMLYVVVSAVQTPVFHLRLRPNYSSELRPHHKILNKCFTIREHLLILL